MNTSGLTRGSGCVIGNNVSFGENVVLGCNCIIEDDVVIGSNCYIDSNSIIRSNVSLGDNCFIGANCIIGEYWMDFCIERKPFKHPLCIGSDALIRSGSIIYAGSEIGVHFQTGHQVTIREKSKIGDNVSVGTLSDIQGSCEIGNYVRMHSNVHIGQKSRVSDFVWIFPYVVLTNDPTPPSDKLVGVTLEPFSIVATGSLIMPGITVGQDALVGAGAIVTKDIDAYCVAVGNPARVISDVRKVKSKITGEPIYPWRHHFSSYMPWNESDFNAWYASLSLEDKEHFGITDIKE